MTDFTTEAASNKLEEQPSNTTLIQHLRLAIDGDNLTAFMSIVEHAHAQNVPILSLIEPLQEAVFAQSEAIIRYLLANGYDPNSHANPKGYTALHVALFDHYHYDLFLADRKPSYRKPVYWSDDWMPMVHLLIAFGADVNWISYTGETPLDLAETLGLYDAMAILRAAKGLRRDECEPEQQTAWLRRSTPWDAEPIPVLIDWMQGEGVSAETDRPMLACLALAKKIDTSTSTLALLHAAFPTITHPSVSSYHRDISRDVGEFFLVTCYGSQNPEAHRLADQLIQTYSAEKHQAFRDYITHLGLGGEPA